MGHLETRRGWNIEKNWFIRTFEHRQNLWWIMFSESFWVRIYKSRRLLVGQTQVKTSLKRPDHVSRVTIRTQISQKPFVLRSINLLWTNRKSGVRNPKNDLSNLSDVEGRRSDGIWFVWRHEIFRAVITREPFMLRLRNVLWLIRNRG